MTPLPTWVYFIQEGDDGPIKIGYTANSPGGRLAALQTGNARPLTLRAWSPGTLEDEKALHARFGATRLTGEWFSPTPELIAFVNGVAWTCRGVELPEAADQEAEDAAEYAFLWSLCKETEELVQFSDQFPRMSEYAAGRANYLFGLAMTALEGGGEPLHDFGYDRVKRAMNMLSMALDNHRAALK